mmetsp:Transcript_2245/g.5049  ORF Transcript_2245/g.5049 Transcript_2245/m.5049 type:complete len:350 (+) Transcript_2245:62-1111(+)|eukprot:CAMPEP_0197896526 /NCGR_PEP_ID=MMETSP1439-20131203/40101_1 /TAXON_ID=66791 /ORGANISM="Gonyaulax spinifera, Strain CCMP409" /LENGTH=349 /DNA_ID=CAMNT_0043517065 /DNA_START=55 /DNA_END=1104 /DNA_ORIENTATION=-
MAEELANAAEEGNVTHLEHLLKKGQIVPETTKATSAVVAACQANQVACLTVLMKWGCPWLSKDSAGRRALHVAAAAGSSECILVLLEYKANVNDLDHNGMTPMKLAMKAKHVDAAKELAMAGAEVPAEIDVPGLAQALREAKIEKLTTELRACAELAFNAEDLAVADTMVWKAMREHQRLLRAREEQKAGALLVSLERMTESEKEAASRTRTNEEEFSMDLSQARVELQKEQSDLKSINRDLDEATQQEIVCFDEDTKIKAEIKERMAELSAAKIHRDASERARRKQEEERDSALKECNSLEHDVGASRYRNKSLTAELEFAEQELSAWHRDREAAAELTTQAHRLLDH